MHIHAIARSVDRASYNAVPEVQGGEMQARTCRNLSGRTAQSRSSIA